MKDKDEIARVLADAHQRMEETIIRIVQLVGDRESESREPIKLLEVNRATSPSGILPIAFNPDPPSIPYPSVVVEVTEEEFAEIQEGRLSLPNGWKIGKTLFQAAA